VVLLVGFSGGLHLDGLSDTADGLLSSKPRERVLEIMRDSHVGPMGVMAIVCMLLVKFASLASLRQEYVWHAAFLMPLAGRCAMVMHMGLLSYVRPDGSGRVFYRSRPYLAAIEVVVILPVAGWLVLGIAGLAVAGVCITVALGLAAYYRYRIGGATGDTFGATCEITETVLALTLTLLPPHVAR
jgi:adenosylcobinamide-GDP ribazoletransferase